MRESLLESGSEDMRLCPATGNERIAQIGADQDGQPELTKAPKPFGLECRWILKSRLHQSMRVLFRRDTSCSPAGSRVENWLPLRR